MVVLTDVAGLYADWPASTDVISTINAADLAALLPSLESGMVPKMEGCLRAVRGGVLKARVIDGRKAHAVRDDVLGASVGGTTVVA
jgi:acetylglutamate kinase